MTLAQRRQGDGGDATDRYVVARILAALIVQAHLAHERGVAERADIDTALKFGTNYPAGPFEWTERIGAEALAEWLAALGEEAGDDRFDLPRGLRVEGLEA